MSELFSLINREDGALVRPDAETLLQLNSLTRTHGLALTYESAVTLLKTRADALKSTRRIEIGIGALDKLVAAFCDSPYLDEQNYVDTLCALTELFYYFKSETYDLLTDDELIAAMKHAFDGECEGSLELLTEREMEVVARNLRAYGELLSPEEQLPAESQDDDCAVEEDGEWRIMRL